MRKIFKNHSTILTIAFLTLAVFGIASKAVIYGPEIGDDPIFECSKNYHFRANNITSDTNFILHDMSDTTNYKHLSTHTAYIHIKNIFVQVDANAAATWDVKLGFLQNVDDTNGDFWIIRHWAGSIQASQDLLLFLPLDASGNKCTPDDTITHGISLNDTAYQTDVNLPSIIDPTTADTPAGNNDLVLLVEVSTGAVDVVFDFAGHTHK